MNNISTRELIIVGFALLAGSWYWFYIDDIKPYLDDKKNDGIACTQEAKLCPDGSYVGRSGPKCEFAACQSADLNETELKYWIEKTFGPIFFCDPDFYPVPREDEDILAGRWFQQVDDDSEEFIAILNKIGFPKKLTYSSDEKLLIYREFKKLRAIQLEPMADDKYSFHIHMGDESGGYSISGAIDRKGNITSIKKEQSFNTCPICTTH